MNPEDIQQHDFFVGLRGYDREEVDAFLADVASEHRALLDELQSYRDGAIAGPDPLAEMGASVTAILRTANEEADQIRINAQQAAEGVRREADEHAAHLRLEAAEYAEHLRREAEDEAARLRDEATHVLERAREQASGLVQGAEASVERIEAEAEQRGRERALERVDVEIGRLTEAARRHEELCARLAETSDEISLARMAMGEPLGDAHAAMQDVILRDTVAVTEH